MEITKVNFPLFGTSTTMRVALARVLVVLCLTVGSAVVVERAQAYAVSENFDSSAGSISNTIFSVTSGSPNVTTSGCDLGYCVTGLYTMNKITSSSTAGQLVFYFKKDAVSGNNQFLDVSMSPIPTADGVRIDPSGDFYHRAAGSNQVQVVNHNDIPTGEWLPVIYSWRFDDVANVIESQSCLDGTCSAWYDTAVTNLDNLSIDTGGTTGNDINVDDFSLSSSYDPNAAFGLTDNYAVITAPESYQQVAYTFDIDGRFNIATTTAPVVSYAIVFQSASGFDYDAVDVFATTSDSSEYTFSHQVTFRADDIVYARVYVYSNDSWNAAGLAVISQEYEFYVSQNAGGTVDLGTIRTGTQSYCQDQYEGTPTSSISVAGVRYALCETFVFFFIPSQTSLNNYVLLASTTANKYPFAYFDDVFDVWDSATSSYATGTDVGSFSLNMASSGIPFSATIYSQDRFTDFVSDWSGVRTVIGACAWLLLLLYILNLIIALTTPDADRFTIDMRN